MDILVRNESSDQEESFKHVCAGRVGSVLSPFSKIAKQLPRLRSKMELPIKIKCVSEYKIKNDNQEKANEA